ncbi:hypothetical protein Gogos_016876 [Gossypium gossypioides]|uniref:DUF4283 domain-containing protein n=1 Tax=Gossypium gossypioides TaxID=34282 RepID=A0A7J9B952_GOSGO|nr:hypothetical protein [Gossypium gossypioides]
MEDEMANLNLADEEEEAFQEEVTEVKEDFRFCLVGSYLTDSVVHFSSLRNTVADLWHPIGGIAITNLSEKYYFFKFFYDIELKRVLKGMSWFFNNHLLMMHKLQTGEDPLTLPLNHAEFWVQIHDLPQGLMSKTMAPRFGSFLGDFLVYDTRVPTLGMKWYMRLKVHIDVRLPLKWKKNVMLGDRMFYAKFQYEKLNLFCFICGKLGHGESFYPMRERVDMSHIIFGWDIMLKALTRRGLMGVSQWLCESDGTRSQSLDKKGTVFCAILGICI